jgi:hypothetical protein
VVLTVALVLLTLRRGEGAGVLRRSVARIDLSCASHAASFMPDGVQDSPGFHMLSRISGRSRYPPSRKWRGTGRLSFGHVFPWRK